MQAQIAGVRAGASPDIYAEVFAQLAARRRNLEDHRAALSASLACREGEQAKERADAALLQRALEDAATALTDPHLTGAEKRLVLGTVVEKALPHKEGADVVFVRSILPSIADKDDTGARGERDTFQTICIGISTQR